MTTCLLLTLLTPAAACLLTWAFSGKRQRLWVSRTAMLAGLITASAAIAVLFLSTQNPQPIRLTLGTWIAIPGTTAVEIAGSLFLDRWSLLLVAAVAIAGGLITVFVAGGTDENTAQLLPPMQSTVFFAMATILAGNFLQLLVAWELLGISTCWLIGKTSLELRTRNQVRKAALILRIGGCGLWLATALIWSAFGTLEISEVLADLSSAKLVQQQSANSAMIVLGLLIAGVAMCAQFPLFVWLPDAVEGPSPAAAVIQSVGPGVAGIYMLARCRPFLGLAPDLLFALAVIGGCTALIAGLIALSQNNMRRLLAFTTIGLQGLMFLALGTGAVPGILAASLLLVAHVFGMSLLCLGRDSAIQHSSAVKSTIVIGLLSMSGIPPLSGFWGMTAILQAVHAQFIGSGETLTQVTTTSWQILFWLAAASIGLMSCALVRAYRLTWNSFPISTGSMDAVAPRVTSPQIAVLCGFAIATLGLGAAIGAPTRWLSQFLSPVFQKTLPQDAQWGFVFAVGAAAAIGGTLLGWHSQQLGRSVPNWLIRTCRPLAVTSRSEFFLNDYFFLGLALPLRAASILTRFVDWFLIDRLIVGTTVKIPLALAKSTRSLQNGLIQFYALAMVLAACLILAIAVWWRVFRP